MLNKKNKGITLIALVITIIILLILAGISILMLTGQNGILNRAQEAKAKNEKSQAQEEVTIALNYLQIENETSSATLTQENKRKILEDELKKSAKDSTVIISGNGYKINHRKYDFYIDENLKLIEDEKEFDPTEWDKTAAPEDIFIWGSNDPNNSEYGTVVGYTDSVDNYPVLRYPSRCTKLGIDNDKYTFYEKYSEGQIFLGSRDITANIEKIELPSTVTEIGRHAFNGDSQGGYNFSSLKSLDLPNSVTKIGNSAFYSCTGLTEVKIPDSVTSIGAWAFADTGLTDVKIPDSVTNIGNYAFSNVAHITYAGKATGSPWYAKSIN
jgi:Tfp pilus assembly protein PilE